MSRRTLAPALAGCALALALAGTTLAGGPNNHTSNSDSFVDPDFCGSGVAVEVAFAETLTEHFTNRPNVDYHQTANGGERLTNLENGRWITTSFTTNFTVALGSGDPDGLHTMEFTFHGVTIMVRSQTGKLLLRDAGTVVFVATLDGEEFLGVELGVNRGSNPNLESDGELFCSVATEALGID